MNGEVFKAWVEKVFIRAVRARTSDRVVLVVDNLSSHEAVDHDKVEFMTTGHSGALFAPSSLNKTSRRSCRACVRSSG